MRDFLRVLQRRLPIVLVAAVLLPSAALAFSLRADKEYTAVAKLLFRDPEFDQKLFGTSILAPSRDPEREAATNVNLVSLDVVTERASRALGGRLSPSQIRDKVEVASEGQADIVAVKATDRTPLSAAKLANTIGEQYILFRRDADRSKITEAIGVVRKQFNALTAAEKRGDEGRSVRARIAQLQLLASLQTGSAELVQPAQSPRTASSPRPVRNAILGLIVGLALGIGLATLLNRLDRRLRHRGDAEAILGRPALAVIPESRALRKVGGGLQLTGREAEAFRTLRTNLRYFDIDHDVHSLLIASSAPGDGKSTVARFLAATAAASNVRVVLLEADLRRPTLDGIFGEAPSPGLTDVLAGRLSLPEVIQRRALNAPSRPDSGQRLDVVTAGPIPPNPTDLLESDRMADVLVELEQRYELVIVDSSPITVVPDAVPIMGRVSGVVIVIREGKSTKVGARQLREQLNNLNVTPLGIVINGAPPANKSDYHGYILHGADEPEDGASPNGVRLSRWSRLRRTDRTASSQETPAKR